MIKKELTNSANSKSQVTDLIKDILDIKKNRIWEELGEGGILSKYTV